MPADMYICYGSKSTNIEWDFFSFERQNGHLYVWYYLHFVQRKNALQRYAFLKIVISLELNISKDCFLNGPTTKVLSIWCPTGYLPNSRNENKFSSN